MSKNSQFEECSTVHLDINGSLAGISDFGEDIVSEFIILWNLLYYGTLDHIDNFFILQPKKVVAILYSKDSNCKAYNYHKVAGDNF